MLWIASRIIVNNKNGRQNLVGWVVVIDHDSK